MLSHTNFSIRAAHPSDLEAFFELDLLCFAPPFVFDRAEFVRYLSSSSTIAIAAESGKELAGFVIVSLTQRHQRATAYVATLDVHPNSRRIGLASTLMEHAEREALARGATTITLHAWSENHPASAFYLRHGYRFAGAVPNYYAPGSHAWLYRKSLVPQQQLEAAQR